MLRSLGRETSGTVAIVFGLAVVPVIGLIGAAVDYSRAVGARATLQAATDAGVLQAAQTAGGLSHAAQLQRIKDVITGRLAGTPLSGIDVSVTSSNGSIQVKASGNVPTTIASLLGHKTVPVSATTQAVWGVQSVEIALVLDNTGSMDETLGGQKKITSLISAATNFITAMQSASGAQSSIKVALVPFDTSVNVGTGNLNACFVDRKNISNYGQ